MPWWGWVTIAAILLVAEMTIVDLEFYLIFLGVSALIVGLLGLSGVVLPYWVQWLAFAAMSVASLVFFRQRLYERMRPPPDGVIQEGVEGGRAQAVDAIAPGATGPVHLRGTRWTGRNTGSVEIPAGATCAVDRADGLVLEIRLEP